MKACVIFIFFVCCRLFDTRVPPNASAHRPGAKDVQHETEAISPGSRGAECSTIWLRWTLVVKLWPTAVLLLFFALVAVHEGFGFGQF